MKRPLDDVAGVDLWYGAMSMHNSLRSGHIWNEAPNIHDAQQIWVASNRGRRPWNGNAGMLMLIGPTDGVHHVSSVPRTLVLAVEYSNRYSMK